MDSAALAAAIVVLVIGAALTLVTKLILGRFDGIEKRLDMLNGHLEKKVDRDDFGEIQAGCRRERKLISGQVEHEIKDLWDAVNKHGHKGLNGNNARVTRGS